MREWAGQGQDEGILNLSRQKLRLLNEIHTGQSADSAICKACGKDEETFKLYPWESPFAGIRLGLLSSKLISTLEGHTSLRRSEVKHYNG